MDQDIESRISKAIDEANRYHKLIFEEKKWTVSFEKKWVNEFEIDPLSALLLIEQPERIKNEDSEIIASLSSALNRRPAWIHSFQCGWTNQNNKSGSISGFLLGSKLRKKFLENENEDGA